MQYVNLGNTGLKVSRLAIGCMMFGSKSWRPWMLEEAEARVVIEKALAEGFTYFDTADSYSLGESERIVGRAVKDMTRRDEVVVSTKVFARMGTGPTTGGLSRKHILDSIDASLKRLGFDYVDLLVCHRWDKGTPLEETLEALNDVVRAGKARYVGASNYFAWQLAKALTVQRFRGWSRFVTVQNVFNLVDREDEREMLPLCTVEGVAITPWSPLARGLLAGLQDAAYGGNPLRAADDAKAQDMYGSEADQAVIARVLEMARQKDAKPAQIALAWLLQKSPLIVPLVGVESTPQVTELATTLTIQLTDAEVGELEMPYRPKRGYLETLQARSSGGPSRYASVTS